MECEFEGFQPGDELVRLTLKLLYVARFETIFGRQRSVVVKLPSGIAAVAAIRVIAFRVRRARA